MTEEPRNEETSHPDEGEDQSEMPLDPQYTRGGCNPLTGSIWISGPSPRLATGEEGEGPTLTGAFAALKSIAVDAEQQLQRVVTGEEDAATTLLRMMDGVDEIAAFIRAAIPPWLDPPACPNCGSRKVAWVLQGLPNFQNEQLMQAVHDGRVILGGCCQGNFWRCPDCAERELAERGARRFDLDAALEAAGDDEEAQEQSRREAWLDEVQFEDHSLFAGIIRVDER
jgi:hypothetical protein